LKTNNLRIKDTLSFGFIDELIPQNAGLFISRGQGIHPKRIITSHELIFVTNGVLDICENNINYTINENQVLLLQPGLLHYGTKNYPSDLKYYWLHFLTTDTGLNFLGNQNLFVQKISNISRPLRLKELFGWYVNDQQEPTEYDKIRKLMLWQILAELELSKKLPQLEKGSINFLVKKVYSCINTRFAEPLTTSLFSEEMHCNSDYLGRVFKKAYNITIMEALKERRIKHAKQLLLENELNINEISRACGFNDVSYFRSTFKKMVGVSPSQYRGSFQKTHINTE